MKRIIRKPKKRGLTKSVYSITFKDRKGGYINKGLFKRKQPLGQTRGKYKIEGRKVIKVQKIKKPTLYQRLRSW